MRWRALVDAVLPAGIAERVRRSHHEAIRQLQREARHGLGSDRHKAGTLAALNALITDATLVNVQSGTWTPNLQVGGVDYAGSYADRQGVYLQIADFVLLACKVSTSLSGLTATSDTIRIADIPHASTVSTELDHWPGWMSQCSLVSGDAHPRLVSGNPTYIYVNSDQRESFTSWTVSNHTFFCAIGAVYKVS